MDRDGVDGVVALPRVIRGQFRIYDELAVAHDLHLPCCVAGVLARPVLLPVLFGSVDEDLLQLLEAKHGGIGDEEPDDDGRRDHVPEDRDALDLHAADWCVDPCKVSVCGFSAGGHAAGCTGVFWDTPHIPGNGRDGRPDAMLLCYAVLSGGAFAHRESLFNLTGKSEVCIENDAYSLEGHITSTTPPAFLWHTFEDSAVPVENALLLAGALHAAGVPAELHAYGHGGHGLALCTKETGPEDAQAATWLPLAVAWLDRMGLGPNR